MQQKTFVANDGGPAGVGRAVTIAFLLVLVVAGLGGPATDTALASELAAAQELQPEARLEIDHLLHYIENSDCLFRRNGDWYGAREAANHIRSKYRFLAARGRICSSEDFIDKAASQSSMTGRLYLVRCAQQEKASSLWLEEELQRYRQHQGAPATE